MQRFLLMILVADRVNPIGRLPGVFDDAICTLFVTSQRSRYPGMQKIEQESFTRAQIFQYNSVSIAVMVLLPAPPERGVL